MDLKFFYNAYNLKDVNIININILNKQLVLTIENQIELELIANGYRPSMEIKHVFEFHFNLKEEVMKKNISDYTVEKYEFYNEYILLVINNIEFKLLSVIVVKN